MRARTYVWWFLALCEVILLPLGIARAFVFFTGDPFIIYTIVVSLILILPAWFITILLMDEIIYCFKGYAAYNPSEPDPPFVYKERGQGKIVFDMIRREHNDGIYYWIYVPEGEKWDAIAPLWARNRRAEILARMIAEMKHDSSIHFEDKP